MSTVSISLNPLMCTAIEIGGAPAGADRLLDFVMAPDVERTCEAFVCRYRELGAVENSIPVAPYDSVASIFTSSHRVTTESRQTRNLRTRPR